MTYIEIERVNKRLLDEGQSAEDILLAWYRLFQEGEFSLLEFRLLLAAVGYGVSPKFLELESAEQKKIENLEIILVKERICNIPVFEDKEGEWKKN